MRFVVSSTTSGSRLQPANGEERDAGDHPGERAQTFHEGAEATTGEFECGKRNMLCESTPDETSIIADALARRCRPRAQSDHPHSTPPTAVAADRRRHAEATHSLTLPADAAGQRFDVALARALPQFSRARLRAWIDAGA